MPSDVNIQNPEIQIQLSQHLSLESGERVVFENDQAVITNRRVFAEFRHRSSGQITPGRESHLREIATVQKLKGGQENRLGPGIRYTLVGATLGFIGYVLEIYELLHSSVDAVLFLVSAVLLGFGLYFVATSVVRVKPHVSVMFIIFGKKDIRVAYPGYENAEADRLAAAFHRAKRSY